MGNHLDDAIKVYARDQTEAALLALQATFMAERVHIPVATPVEQLQPGQHDVPVICIKTETGAGAIPVFTSVEHLLKWKRQRCLYTSITGRSLIAMATRMQAITEVLVNPNDAPGGRIPRADFERMLAMPQYGLL
jgi:hypothetical protein